MAQPSFEFALGRISVLSTHLLSASQLRRIAEAGSTGSTGERERAGR